MLTRVELIEKYSKGVQLRGDIQTLFTRESVAFHGKTSFAMSTLSCEDIQFLRGLKKGLLLENVSSLRSWKLLALLESRAALKYLSPVDENRQVEWLSYFHSAPQTLQNEIGEKTVMLVGCGGTGAIIATHLARAGVNHFVLIDPAVVDAPDLNRQLNYFPEDLGIKKVDALAVDLRRLRPNVTVRSIPFAVEGVEDLRKWIREARPNLVINCADKPLGLIHAWVAEASRELEVPVLFGGVGLGDASVGPLLLDSSSKRVYEAAMTRAHAAFSAAEQPLKASLCFTNSWASVMIAFEAFKYLTGIGEIKTLNRSVVVDFFEQSTKVEAQWCS